MRLRTFAASDMAKAMALVRQELGDDAIIVSSENGADGVRITAAVEETQLADPIDRELARPPFSTLDGGDVVDAVHEALLGHGLPNRLLERLVDASFLIATDDAATALAGALSALFKFRAVDHGRSDRPIMLIGAPGAGKTMTAVKFAARLVMAGRTVRLITTDTVRAGAVEQLAAFAKLLGAPFSVASSPNELARMTGDTAAGEQVLIDTAGINPRVSGDVAELAGLIDAARAEPVLVAAAGGDSVEAMEQAAALSELGAARLIATRIDTVRRLGGILAAADAGNLALAEYGFSPSVANGLARFDPKNLARMLIPDTVGTALATATVVGGRKS